MQTLKKALDLGLITKVTMTAKCVNIFSKAKPDGFMCFWDYYAKNIEPKLAAKCQQAEEAQAGTLESQA